MRCLLLILFLSCTMHLHAQVKSIDKYSLEIDSLYRAGKLTEKQYPNMSFCGGSLKGYYHHDKLVYIHTVYGGEMGYYETHYFIRDSVLLKAASFRLEYTPADDMDAYCKKHKLPGGNCDFRGLPKTTELVKRYFTAQDTIVYAKRNGSHVTLSKEEKQQEIGITRDCYPHLLKELSEIE